MEYNTSQLCDIYQDQVDVVEPMFSTFGGRSSFGGQVTTIKCFEANGIIRQLVKENGIGRVLLIDGGGSLRRALIDAEIAATAADNGWEGIICYGSVREVDALADLDIVCEFEQQDGARNHAGRYQIHSWGPVDKAWIGQHLAQIKQVLGYP